MKVEQGNESGEKKLIDKEEEEEEEEEKIKLNSRI